MAQIFELVDDDIVILDRPPPPPPSAPSRPPSSRRKEKQADHPAVHVKMEVDPTHVPIDDAGADTAAATRPSASANGVNGGGDVVDLLNSEPGSPQQQMQKESPGNSLPADPAPMGPPASASPPSSKPPSVSLPHSPPPPLTNGDTANGDEKPQRGGSQPPQSAPAPGPSQKPKSTKAPKRSPSPELVPPPPPPRLRTIRLDIRLGGPDNYAVDIAQLARDTGQRSLTPPPALKPESSDSEAEADDDAKGAKPGRGRGKGKAGKKKSLVAEYYDLNDPFIDDSELAVDERTYFAQTKQQGFYVSSGEVALLKDRARDRESERDVEKSPVKKPKSKKNVVPTIIPLAGSHAVSAAAASASAAAAGASPTDPFGPPPPLSNASSGDHLLPGTRETPIAVSDTEEAKANGSANGLKRKASVDAPSASQAGGKKKRKTVDIEMFHPDLQVALHELKVAIAAESFDQKGKFPPTLKPLLARVALKAIVCGEYNDNFFSLMPKLFIYNKFTMTKLIKRTVYADHQKLLVARQDELLEELRSIAEESFAKAQDEYEKNVQAWEKRMEKAKTETTGGPGAASAEGTPVPGSATPSVNGSALLPPAAFDGGTESGMDVDAPPATGDKDGDKDGPSAHMGMGHAHSSQHMPTKRYRLTERMRNIIWELVVLSNESCRIENEKNTLENSTVQVSEQGTRKVLYQKIVAAFPEGWMSSGQISREGNVMKKRFEAQQAEES
ncbi:hypothetical protein DFH11DRAFT_1508285 [Phellopilus nigrolimitatus]|nr:hypothetical protein DFH11DRAFT_1508285 [Phellopilus nigrolimitatus]